MASAVGTCRIFRTPYAWHVGNVEVEKPNDLRLLEANIDDMSPEVFGSRLDRLSQSASRGRLVQFNSNEEEPSCYQDQRHCPEAAMESEVANLLLEETSTLGVRVIPITRYESRAPFGKN